MSEGFHLQAWMVLPFHFIVVLLEKNPHTACKLEGSRIRHAVHRLSLYTEVTLFFKNPNFAFMMDFCYIIVCSIEGLKLANIKLNELITIIWK